MTALCQQLLRAVIARIVLVLRRRPRPRKSVLPTVRSQDGARWIGLWKVNVLAQASGRVFEDEDDDEDENDFRRPPTSHFSRDEQALVTPSVPENAPELPRD